MKTVKQQAKRKVSKAKKVKVGNIAQKKRTPKVKRTYKDTMFRMIFKEKENLLSLYNAINGTNHTNTNDLVMNTLEHAIYLGYKNDISFMINLQLYLYEHQSSVNPNMPLRDLFYVSEILQDITRDEDLYSSARKKIPTPKFMVFYNGMEEMPEKWELRLSEAFQQPTNKPELELVVTVVNINFGKNKKLMKACKVLHDYAFFVKKMRDYSKRMSPEEAAEQTINDCLKQGILTDFLKKHSAEAKNMCRCLYEYDEEKHMREERKLAREAGLAEGRAEGLIKGHAEGRVEGQIEKLVFQICRKLTKNYNVSEIADMLEEEEGTVQKICDIAQKFSPAYDSDEVIKHLKEIENNP